MQKARPRATASVLIFVLQIFVLQRMIFKVFESLSNIRNKAREAYHPITKAWLLG
jgi:hypothetical protein